MTDKLDQLLAAMEARGKAADGRRWAVEHRHTSECEPYITVMDADAPNNEITEGFANGGDCADCSGYPLLLEGNADFIAHAKTDLPRCVKAIRKQAEIIQFLWDEAPHAKVQECIDEVTRILEGGEDE